MSCKTIFDLKKSGARESSSDGDSSGDEMDQNQNSGGKMTQRPITMDELSSSCGRKLRKVLGGAKEDTKARGSAGKMPAENKLLDKLMEKSVIQPGFEKQYGIGAKHTGKRTLKKMRQTEKAKTKGADWFGLPATEATEERKRDLELIAMRSAIDPKRFYRDANNPDKPLPKYFQIGTVIEDKTEFYSDRVPVKQRKRTMVEELLADQDFQKRSVQKYREIKAREMIARKGANFGRRKGPKKSPKAERRKTK